MFRTCIVFAFLIIFLSACVAPEIPSPTIFPSATTMFRPMASQTPEPMLTITPNSTEFAQATLDVKATNSAAHFATSVAAMTATAFAKPTIIPSPTLIHSPTPIISLTNREPSFEELENFLNTDLKDFYGLDKWAVETYYQDVNGDEETDLIVLHPPEIFVLTWTGSEYLQSFYLNGNCGMRCFPSSYIKFEDWTNDGVPEIIFDNSQIGGGTAYWTYDLTRWIIRCSNNECRTVWEMLVQSESDDYDESYLGLYSVQTTPVIQEGVPGIRSIAKGFRIIMVFPGESTEFSYTALEVDRTIVSIYLWNGESFELASEETLSLPSSFDSRAVLFAENAKRTQAGIQLVDDEEHDFFNGMNKLCQLIISGVSTNNSFPCKDDFTIVFWQDITGDGEYEAIVQTLFRSDPSEYFDCAIQQRLLAYTWDGQTATLIADASGCVTRPEDLYGVRLEDYDGDGLPEIIAAQLDADNPERIYKFNGTEFVFWSEMPQK